MDRLAYKEFEEKVKDALVNELNLAGEEIDVILKDMPKMNQTRRALYLQPRKQKDETQIMPIIYTDALYQNYMRGMPLETVVGQCMMAIENRPKSPNILIPQTKEDLFKKLIPVLINKRSNKQIIDSALSWPVDIAGDNDEYVMIVKHNTDDFSFNITEKICQHFHVTPDEVLQTAKENAKNMKPYFEPIRGLLSTIPEMKMKMPPEKELGADEMYVASINRKLSLGASILIFPEKMQACFENMKHRYPDMQQVFVFPTSVHEIIFLYDDPMLRPSDDFQPEAFYMDMHKDIQANQVDIEDRLSDKIYIYDGKTLSQVKLPEYEKGDADMEEDADMQR